MTFKSKSFVDHFTIVSMAAYLQFILVGCSTTLAPVPTHTNNFAWVSIQEPSTFNPSYLVPAGEDAFMHVHEIYQSSPAPGEGCYVHQGIVFVAVVGTTDQHHLERMRFFTEQRAAQLLRASYPFLPHDFKLTLRLVERLYDSQTKIYRYVTAYRLSDIRAYSPVEKN